jgi:predicted nucleic acid-binding Zn ribbon protein
MSQAKQLNQLIDQFLSSIGIKNKIDQYSSFTYWDSVVGKDIAERTEPFNISKGILLVRVKDTAWRNELQYFKNEIIKKLNDRIGKKIVTDIKFL